MVMTTPYLNQVKPFSPTVEYTFNFVYSSGEQMNKNNLVIQRVSDNVMVYDQTIESFSAKHTVPASTLQSGNYKAKLRVGSVNGNWSQFSDWIFFWVLHSPTLTIDNIDYENQNRVYNQTVIFSSTYNQSDNELLQSFRYLLFDSNQNLIQSYSEQFSDGTSPLAQEVTGLQNGELYYIELKIITVNGLESTTGLVLVRPFYIAPRINSAIMVKNDKSEGAIKLTANIIQIVGKLYGNNGNLIESELIEYVDNEKLDMNREDYARLVFNEGFNTINSDFIMKLWCSNIPDDKVFLTLYAPQGKLEFMKYDNKIHILKYTYSVTYPSHYISNEYTFVDNQQFMIYVKSLNNAIDIEVLNS